MGKSKYVTHPPRILDTRIPLLNQIIDTFFLIALVAVARLVALELYHFIKTGKLSGDKTKALKRIGNEGVYWGTIAALYIGLAYGAKLFLPIGEWMTVMVSGALTGAIVSSTANNNNKDKIVADSITGSSIAMAAKVLDYLT